MYSPERLCLQVAWRVLFWTCVFPFVLDDEETEQWPKSLPYRFGYYTFSWAAQAPNLNYKKILLWRGRKAKETRQWYVSSMFKCPKFVRVSCYVRGYFLETSSLGRHPDYPCFLSRLSEMKQNTTKHKPQYQNQKFIHFSHLETPVHNPMCYNSLYMHWLGDGDGGGGVSKYLGKLITVDVVHLPPWQHEMFTIRRCEAAQQAYSRHIKDGLS